MLRSIVVFCVVALSAASFSQTITFSRSQSANKGAPTAQGDLNGDGLLDIVSPGAQLNPSMNGFYVTLSNANGSYQAPVFYAPPYQGNPSGVALGDFKGDGKVDVAEVEDTHDYYIFLNSGNGKLAPSWNFATQSNSRNDAIATADFNRDGKLDLVIVSVIPGLTQLEILLGKGDGTFSAPVIFDANAKGGNLLVGDFDSDGIADVAMVRGVCDRGVGCFTNIRVYYGDGKGGFSGGQLVGDGRPGYYFMVSHDGER